MQEYSNVNILKKAGGGHVLSSDNTTIDLDGVFDGYQPEVLKAWADPDPKSVFLGCKHIVEFGSYPDTLANHEYRTSVYSILLPLMGTDNLVEWTHSKLENVDGYDQWAIGEEIVLAARVTPYPYTCEEMLKHSKVDCEACASGDYTSPINIRPVDYIESEATGFWDTKVNKTGQIISQTPNYPDLYKKWEIGREHVTVVDTGMVYVYNSTHWEFMENLAIKSWVQDTMKPWPKETHSQQFLQYIKCSKQKTKDWAQNSTDGLINLQNGVFNIVEDTVSAHSADYGFRYILPYGYDADAKCPRFLQFMDEVTLGKDDLQQVLLEFMGYALANGECFAEKAAILYGSGANGKSTFMDVLKALAGSDNYSPLSLSALGSSTKRVMTEGKLFNIGEETNIKALKDSEVFKTMVTGGEIDVKRLYIQEYSVKNRCKLIMACNDLPLSSDRSDGLYRRLLLIPFSAHFSETQKDPEIREKLFAELPGIFNLAVDGYRRLKANRWQFSQSETIAKVLSAYKTENDNVLRWSRDFLEYTNQDTDLAFRHEMYDSYRRECEEDGSFAVNKIIFFKHLRSVLRECPFKETKKLHPMKRSRVWVFKGLKLQGGTLV